VHSQHVSSRSKQQRKRQRRALAAGGIVLGVGAVLVAASWTDRVLGNSDFGSSKFGIESSTDGGFAWSSHPIGAPNSLVFTSIATGLVPGSVVYAPVQLRVEAGSEPASVALQGASFSGTGVGNLSTELRYRVVRNAPTCDAAAFASSPTFVVGAGGAAALNTPAPSSFPLVAGAVPTDAGPAVPLCFEISLPATNDNWSNAALPNKTLVANWPFIGTL
jgi:hypothetical protein